MSTHTLTNEYGDVIAVPVGAIIQNRGNSVISVTSDASPTGDSNALRIPVGKAFKNSGSTPLSVRARALGSKGLMSVVTGL